MRIDVWADLVCPFCHVGRRRLDLALEQFEHGDQFDVIWHSFQLDRNAPAVSDRPVIDQVADKYGVSREQMVVTHEHMATEAAEVGLDFQWEQLQGGNSYDAHRLIHFARAQGRESAVTDRIMRGWYSEGAALGDRDTLTTLAVEAGLDEHAVRELLAGDEYGIDVRTDEAMAAQLGITAVPTFVFDQKYAVQGAQPVEIIVNALRHTWEDQGNPATPAPSGGCGGGCCGGGGCGSAEGADGTEAQGCGDGACGDLCGTQAHAH
jgi:predicted DsbA family dithiol-disulfide isomerase